jgi:hypothetical protein
MRTLNSTLAGLRTLCDEEMDLVGGAWSAEGTYYLTRCNAQCSPPGCPHTVPDDSSTDIQFD